MMSVTDSCVRLTSLVHWLSRCNEAIFWVVREAKFAGIKKLDGLLSWIPITCTSRVVPESAMQCSETKNSCLRCIDKIEAYYLQTFGGGNRLTLRYARGHMSFSNCFMRVIVPNIGKSFTNFSPDFWESLSWNVQLIKNTPLVLMISKTSAAYQYHNAHTEMLTGQKLSEKVAKLLLYHGENYVTK